MASIENITSPAISSQDPLDRVSVPPRSYDGPTVSARPDETQVQPSKDWTDSVKEGFDHLLDRGTHKLERTYESALGQIPLNGRAELEIEGHGGEGGGARGKLKASVEHASDGYNVTLEGQAQGTVGAELPKFEAEGGGGIFGSVSFHYATQKQAAQAMTAATLNAANPNPLEAVRLAGSQAMQVSATSAGLVGQIEGKVGSALSEKGLGLSGKGTVNVDMRAGTLTFEGDVIGAAANEARFKVIAAAGAMFPSRESKIECQLSARATYRLSPQQFATLQRGSVPSLSGMKPELELAAKTTIEGLGTRIEATRQRPVDRVEDIGRFMDPFHDRTQVRASTWDPFSTGIDGDVAGFHFRAGIERPLIDSREISDRQMPAFLREVAQARTDAWKGDAEFQARRMLGGMARD